MSITSQERLWSLKSREELLAWAQEVGIQTGNQYTWAILEHILEADPPKCEPGPDEEWVRIAARLAVRNCDPEYRGYTPWGNIG